MDPKISFIILTWNSEKYISRCVEAIRACQWSHYEAIIIDNGSTDGTLPRLLELQSALSASGEQSLTIIPLDRNHGTTHSRNLGLRAVSPDSEYICVLDSDACIQRDALEKMIAALRLDPRNAVCGPSMRNLEGEAQISAKKIPTALLKFCKACPIGFVQNLGINMEKYDLSKAADGRPVGYLISACWLMPKSAVDAIGPLDEKIFYSPEDVEYCVRTWTKGFRVIYCPSAQIIHAVQRISKKKLISRHNWEHLKGLIYFFHKYGLFFSSKHIDIK